MLKKFILFYWMIICVFLNAVDTIGLLTMEISIPVNVSFVTIHAILAKIIITIVLLVTTK